MQITQIIQEYFITPIVMKTGYNPINTITYAIIALCAIYFIYTRLNKEGLGITRQFFAGAIAWTFFGSSIRVVTDAIDSKVFLHTVQELAEVAQTDFGARIVHGIYTWILQSNIFEYTMFTVTPGIYIVIATGFLLTYFIERKLEMPYWCTKIGAVFAICALIILAPMIKYAQYAVLVLAVAGTVSFAVFKIFNLNELEYRLAIFAHTLDGMATWTAIDIFGPANDIKYFEQHVLSSAIGEATDIGYGLFFITKVLFALIAVKVAQDEKQKNIQMIALLAIAIMGLAPGLRNLLRMIAGT